MTHICLVFVFACGVLGAGVAAGGETGWIASPENVEAARQRAGFNYEEQKVPEYELPPILQMADGVAVSTPAQWEARRKELRELFERYVYGRMPPEPTSLQVEVLEEDPEARGGTATLKRLKITADVGALPLSFPAVVLIPDGEVKGVFILINHRDADNINPRRESFGGFWPADAMLARGYAMAAFLEEPISPDKRNFYRTGLIERVVLGKERPGDGPGSLAAWAWGASRVLDAVREQPGLAGRPVAVVGHSRGSKASLLAGAFDERFDLTICNAGGAGGAALSRRAFGETVEEVTGRFPHWFAPRFAEFASREQDLPVDQHQLLALVAPRGLYVASADEDLWADPRGVWLSLAEAGKAYALLGEPALQSSDTMPPLDRPLVGGKTGYHIRGGGHDLTEWDWQRFADFADELWLGDE